MTQTQQWTARALIVAVTLVLCGIPELAEAQATAPNSQTTPASSAGQDAQAPANESSPATQQNNGVVDPSRAPLQPVPTEPAQPEANSTAPGNNQGSANAQLPPQKKPEQPAGAAVGQRGAVAGGAASKPAGNALAPAKQRQARSLLIKAGLIGAAAIAIGTVVALSKGSPSKPPGAH